MDWGDAEARGGPTSAENFLGGRGLHSRQLSLVHGGRSAIAEEGDGSGKDVRVDDSSDSLEALKAGVVRRLRFNREELVRKHFGIQKPDDEMLRDILEHFRAREAPSKAVRPPASARAALRTRKTEPALRPPLTATQVGRKMLGGPRASWALRASPTSSGLAGQRSTVGLFTKSTVEPRFVRGRKQSPTPGFQTQIAALTIKVKQLEDRVRHLSRENKEIREECARLRARFDN